MIFWQAPPVPASLRVANYTAQIIQREESIMPTFIVTMNFTDQGIRTIKDAPKRAAAARELAKKLGVDIKQLFLTTGDSDLLAIVEAADGAVLVKFCMTIGAAGNLRTKTARAWPEAEYMKMVSELP
jgi:uncharacterized protein with GYD domain